MGPERKRALDIELAMLLDTGKVEPSTSPWASPVVMVPKKNGQYRICIDYRKLNAVTRVDAFPMPTVDAILASLHGAQIFSSLDLRSGYWQMSVAQEDREKTVFVCDQGLFQFWVLPFGVVNGPASFQRLMSEVLGDLVGRNCYVYLDDIVCLLHQLLATSHWLAGNPADYATEKDDLAQTGNDQNQTGLAVQIHLIRASKPANNIREFTDQSSILNRSHYRSPIAKYRYRTFSYKPFHQFWFIWVNMRSILQHQIFADVAALVYV